MVSDDDGYDPDRSPVVSGSTTDDGVYLPPGEAQQVRRVGGGWFTIRPSGDGRFVVTDDTGDCVGEYPTSSAAYDAIGR